MKRKNGKKVRKIVLLVILAVVAGVVLYDLVFCWPVHPSLQKPAESYKQLSQTAKKLGVLAPPEDILPGGGVEDMLAGGYPALEAGGVQHLSVQHQALRPAHRLGYGREGYL